MNAVYAYFLPCWGQRVDGAFAGAPGILKSLRPSLVKKTKFLGGMYDMVLKTVWHTESDENWTIVMQRRIGRKTRFATNSKSEWAGRLVERLNGNVALIADLDRLDLEGVTIRQQANQRELNVSPYGGGVCFLMIPPVRYTVPLPVVQRDNMVRAIEQLAGLLASTT
jgi:hypothetical protein